MFNYTKIQMYVGIVVSLYMSMSLSNFKIANFLGGEYIEIVGNKLTIVPTIETSSINILFLEQHNDHHVKNESINLNKNVNVKLSKNGKVLTACYFNEQDICKTDKSIFKTNLDVNLYAKGKSLPISRIKEVRINGEKISLSEVIDKSKIQLIANNVSSQYKYSIRNIGYQIAKEIGVYIPIAIIALLLPLVIIQLVATLLFIFGDYRDFLVKKYKKIDVDLKYNLTIIDIITKKIAIPLGLLGTISSIWSAFELMNFEIGNIQEILKLLTNALFTTFLAFSSYILLSSRAIIESQNSEK